MSHVVDRQNLDFLFYAVFGLEEILSHADFVDYDRAAISGILDTTQALSERELAPCAAELDANEPKFVDGKVVVPDRARQALQACASAGLFAAMFDAEVGGLGLPYMVSTALNGILGCGNLALANYLSLTVGNANIVREFGTYDQKRCFLPPMLEGRWFGTMCLSETQAGSSLSDIQTKAEPADEGGYRISGSKMWISGGDHEMAENIVHLVLARIPGSPAGVKGISLFLVPKYRVSSDGCLGEFNNVAVAGLNHKMGQRGTTNCLLNFGEGGDCIGQLVGEPNKGLSYMFQMMNEARIGVGTSSVMSALSGYLFSLDYARTRLQGRRIRDKDPLAPQVAIIEHADVRRMLLAQKAAVEGGLALSCLCASLIDRQRMAAETQRDDLALLLELLTPVMKSWPSEHCLEANKLAIQILGGYGYTRDYPVERFYRDNRLNHIHEGTFAIHGIDLLGRKVRMQDGRALQLLAEKLAATIGRARDCAPLADSAGDLEGAFDALKKATAAVSGCDDPELALANATLYLDNFGHVVVAWLWLEQALAAHAALADDRADYSCSFLEGKLAACRYFYRYELPKVHAGFTLVGSLDDTGLRMMPQAFLGA